MIPTPYYVRDEGHRYVLQSHPSYYFRVGRSVGQQFLWGLLFDRQLTVEFDLNGCLQNHEVNRLESLAVDSEGCVADSMLEEMSRGLERRVSVVADVPISVLRFWLPALDVGIEDLGSTLKEFIIKPEEFSTEEVKEYEHILPDWTAAGKYVFQWNNDFYVDARGNVETS